jgi:hypothetical protein
MADAKYPTLSAFVDSVRDGSEPPDTFTVFVDNDAVYAYRGDDCLWREDDGPGEALISALELLGIPAEFP